MTLYLCCSNVETQHLESKQDILVIDMSSLVCDH